MLCAMYFAQGVPWGFMTIALISYLAARGVDDTAAGNLTAVVLVPWTFKLIWGPIIDTMTIRSMGRRRPWIIGAELMMAVSLLGLLMMGDLTNNLRLLGWMPSSCEPPSIASSTARNTSTTKTGVTASSYWTIPASLSKRPEGSLTPEIRSFSAKLSITRRLVSWSK